MQPLPGDAAGAAQSDSAGLQPGTGRRVVTGIEKVSEFVHPQTDVGIQQAVVLARCAVGTQRWVVVTIRTGVTQAATEGAHVIGVAVAVGGIDQEEAHAVGAVTAVDTVSNPVAPGVTPIGHGLEENVHTGTGREREVGNDAAGLVVAEAETRVVTLREAVGQTQRARASCIRQRATGATDQSLVLVIAQSDTGRDAS